MTSAKEDAEVQLVVEAICDLFDRERIGRDLGARALGGMLAGFVRNSGGNVVDVVTLALWGIEWHKRHHAKGQVYA